MFAEIFVFAVTTTAVSWAGVVPIHGIEEGLGAFHGSHHSADNGGGAAALHQSHASSFMHFHGPVEGPVFEVKVPYVPHHDEHAHLHGEHHQDHGYTLDYVAQPKYEFSYGVEDHHTGDFHAQKESRDGKTVRGEYSVKEPGGNVRTVKYHADHDGFHAVVHNSGGNDHSGGVYGGHGALEVHGGEQEVGQEEDHRHQHLDLGHGAPVQEEHELQEYAIFQGHEEGGYL